MGSWTYMWDSEERYRFLCGVNVSFRNGRDCLGRGSSARRRGKGLGLSLRRVKIKIRWWRRFIVGRGRER